MSHHHRLKSQGLLFPAISLGLQRTVGFALALVVALLLVSAPSAVAQSEIDMAAMMEFMAPGEQHAALAAEAGEFLYESTVWMFPDQPSATTRGEVTRTMILDGRYMREELSGTVMGLPFRGVGVTGYDKTIGKYRSTWIDSLGTGILNFTGEVSEDDASTVVYHGEAFNPMVAEVEQIRAVNTTLSANEQHFFYYVTTPGQEERLQMKVIYWRKGTEEPSVLSSEEPAADVDDASSS